MSESTETHFTEISHIKTKMLGIVKINVKYF